MKLLESFLKKGNLLISEKTEPKLYDIIQEFRNKDLNLDYFIKETLDKNKRFVKIVSFRIEESTKNKY